MHKNQNKQFHERKNENSYEIKNYERSPLLSNSLIVADEL